MKNSSFVIAALLVMAFSSCYVGIEGGHRHRRHNGASLEIRGENNVNQKDSLSSSISSPVNMKDSLGSSLGTDSIK